MANVAGAALRTLASVRATAEQTSAKDDKEHWR